MKKPIRKPSFRILGAMGEIIGDVFVGIYKRKSKMTLDFKKDADGVVTAQANGFKYTVKPPHPVEQCWYLEVEFEGDRTEIVLSDYQDFEEGCKEAANFHVAAVQAACDGKWISVKERLPEFRQEVLAYFGNSKEIGSKTIRVVRWHPEYIVEGVTHYRLLPPPPSGKGKE